MIELPWPSASLSGHSGGGFARGGHWAAKASITKQHREWALKATLAVRSRLNIPLADDSDIHVSATFYPPSRRGDRVNFPSRLKPYWDGIADALCVNDRRFLPAYHFAEPVKGGKVVIVVGKAE